jgi:hypothetical protein
MQATPVIEKKPPVIEPRPEPIPQAKPEVVPPAKSEPVPPPKPEPVLPMKSEPVPQPKPQPLAPEEEKAEVRYAGKYEIFPEAGLFKYRLKASNGEILIVSQGYSTAKGAQSGIETLKRNVENANFEIYTDKNNFSQFILNSATGGRIIATGEFYDSVKRCESAVASVKRFFKTEKVVVLDELPTKEIREEILEAVPVEKKPNGKVEVLKEKDEWLFCLKASNAEVLFLSQGYSTKAGCLAGLETIKKAVENANFRISKDKMGRYQFTLYSASNQPLLSGETYPDKDNCISAAHSVRKFMSDAKIVEL